MSGYTEALDLLLAIEEACPVCGGEGWTVEADPTDETGQTSMQMPCWDAEHAVLLNSPLNGTLSQRRIQAEAASGDAVRKGLVDAAAGTVDGSGMYVQGYLAARAAQPSEGLREALERIAEADERARRGPGSLALRLGNLLTATFVARAALATLSVPASEPSLDAELLARAYHASACPLGTGSDLRRPGKGLAFHSCKFREAHRHSMAAVAAEYVRLRPESQSGGDPR